MDIALLTDIKRKLQIRSALLSVPFDELLSINDILSPDEILLEIIKKSLREFEHSLPLILEMPITRGQLSCCGQFKEWAEIKSNFLLWLDCKIDESRIVLVPNSIPYWRIDNGINYGGAGSWTPCSNYNRPLVYLADLPMYGDQIIFRAIVSRPIIPDFTADKMFNKDSNKAAVYWMNIEEGERGAFFLDICMMNLLDFIRQLKASISLPNVPMDILGNVDSAYQELRARVEQNHLQSGWYGDLLF